jgi:predicted transcriptional regulator
MPRTPEEKANVAAMMAARKSYREIHEATGINPATISHWLRDDEEFIELRQRITDGVVASNVQSLRALSEKAVQRLDEALDATEGVTLKLGDEVTFEQTPDFKTRSITAERVLKRIAEFAEQQHVDVGGTVLERLMDELDEPASAGG